MTDDQVKEWAKKALADYDEAAAGGVHSETSLSVIDAISKCLRLYSKPGDVVMDPFNGIGSTGYEAVKMSRRYLGFELKPEYAAQANANLQDAERTCEDLFS